jgi:hypothetical protein
LRGGTMLKEMTKSLKEKSEKLDRDGKEAEKEDQ